MGELAPRVNAHDFDCGDCIACRSVGHSLFRIVIEGLLLVIGHINRKTTL